MLETPLTVIKVIFYFLCIFFSYCVIDLLIVYSTCNSVLSAHTAMLYLGQVAVANENLFSTCLPG
jgi:hypothetical protein